MSTDHQTLKQEGRTDCLQDPLKQAIEENDAATTRFLIARGAPVDYSALELSVRCDHVDSTKALLEAAGPKLSLQQRQDALLFAIQARKQHAVVSTLLEAGNVDPNFQANSPLGPSPLFWAILRENEAIVKLLLQRGAKNFESKNRIGECMFPLMIVSGNATIASLLIAHGADPDHQNEQGQTALQYACSDGFLDTAKALRGADPNLTNENDEAPLHLACLGGHLPVIRWLVENAGANPTLPTKCPPLKAAFIGQLLPRALLELGLNPWQPGEDGNSVVHAAITEDRCTEQFRSKFVNELLEYDPALVYARDRDQNTPLHLAKSEEMVRVLVETHGADLMDANRFGHTPLISAVLSFQNDDTTIASGLVSLMHERGLDVDVVDGKGWTALHYAVLHRMPNIVHILLEFGANPNKLNPLGRSALHMIGYPVMPGGRKLSRYGDGDISRILNTQNFPSNNADRHEANLIPLKRLIARGGDCALADQDSNLPFFLAAATSHVAEAYLMVRAAASQGLFDPPRNEGPSSKRKPTNEGQANNAKRGKGSTT